MKRIIISGGGTGGHIYPALAIAEKIAAFEPVEFLYIGTKNGLEAQLVPREGYTFKTLSVQGLNRKLSWQTVVTLKKGIGSLWDAEKILRDFKPHAVIGTGGYVCGPVLLMAALHGIPTLIQEQNVIPGVTNKILSRFVDVVATGYEEAKTFFKSAKKVVYTGNPVRETVLQEDRNSSRKAMGLAEDLFTVLVAGGSRGARSINEAMIEVHKHFADDGSIRIIHSTGAAEYERVCHSLGVKPGEEYSKSSAIVPYLYDMPKVMTAVDLAVFRAGAVGLAELAACGIPSILIPYPYAAEDHQTYNARAFVSRGAAKMIVDKVLSGKELIGEIEYLKSHRDKLLIMQESSKKIGKPDAAEHIARMVLDLAKKSSEE